MILNLRSLAFGFLGALLFRFAEARLFPSANARAEVQSASAFNLVDGQGKLRAQLGFSKEGPPGFWIMDEKGTARLAMGLYPDGSSHFGLQDKQGRMIELMRSFGPGESPLLIFKSQGEDRMISGLSISELTPFLVTIDKDHKRKMQFGTYDGP